MELYKMDLTGAEFRILFCIIRKTWGYHKKADEISISQLVLDTGLVRSCVCHSLNELVRKNFLIKIKSSIKGSTTVYQINKDYDKWVVLSRGLGSPQNTTKVVLSRGHTKDIYTKEISTTNVVEGDALKRDVNYFIDLFKEVNPAYKRLFSNKTQRKSIENLLEQFDEYQLEKMIKFLPRVNATKYAPVITTPYDLETKLGALQAFYLKERHGNTNIAFESYN